MYTPDEFVDAVLFATSVTRDLDSLPINEARGKVDDYIATVPQEILRQRYADIIEARRARLAGGRHIV